MRKIELDPLTILVMIVFWVIHAYFTLPTA
jgi:hypothetical protein